MKKVLFMAVATAAVLSSCSKNEVTPNVTEANAISFSPYTSKATKGVELDQAGLVASGFGVFGYFQDNGDTWLNTMTPNYMFNQEVTASGANWIYDPVKYWSNDVSDLYSFFAYAPYEDGTIIDVTSVNNAKPAITYTIPTDSLTKAIDFVAGQVLNVDKQDNAVEINLKHQLTRLNIQAKSSVGVATNGADATDIIIRSINIASPAAGGASVELPTKSVYTFGEADTDATITEHAQDGTWAHSAYGSINLATILAAANNPEYGTGTVYPENTGIKIDNESTGWTSLFAANEYMFLIPPADGDGLTAADDIKFEIIYDILTEDSAVENGYTFSSNKVEFDLGTADGLLKQGVAYNFQLTFTLTEVKLSATVLDWDTVTEDGTEFNISGVVTTVPTVPAP